jgi:all-trans-retinol dehydrogenase (NAD+)
VGFDEALRLELKRQKINVRTTVVCPYYIDTGMFEGVKTRFPFLLPILKPEYVVNRIIKAIRRNRRRLIMPRFVTVSYLVRILPVPVFDALISFFGINKTMDEFEGRSKNK